MNRRQRSYTGPDYLAAIVRRTPPCPDCCADAELWTDEHGLHHMEIRHDDTCPVLRAHTTR